jgi:hypothetical protein
MMETIVPSKRQFLQEAHGTKSKKTAFSIKTMLRMASSGMLRRVAVGRTDVLVELSASVIRLTRIDGLGTTLGVTSNRFTLRRNILVTLMMKAPSSS